MTRFINAYEKDCAGFTLNYTSNGSGAGVKEFIGGQTDFGGSDSPLNAEKDELDKAAGALRRQPGVEPAGRLRPDRDHLQRRGRRRAGARRPDRWPRSSTAPSRPGTTRRSRRSTRRQAARGEDRRDLPLRRVGHHRQLPEVPGRRLRRRVGQGRRQDFDGGVGEGAKGNEGTSAAVKSTKGSITYNEWSFAKAQKPVDRPDHHLRGHGPGRADRRDRGQGHRRREDQGRGQRPGPRHRLVLQADRAGRLPDRAGHLRDRLLQVPRRRDRQGRQGVPDLGSPTARRVSRTTATFRCRRVQAAADHAINAIS